MSVLVVHPENSLIHNLVDALNSRDLDAICSLYNDNAVLVPSTVGHIWTTPEEIRDHFLYCLQIDQLEAIVNNSVIMYDNGNQFNAGQYSFTWKEDNVAKTAKARFSLIISNNKILFHHSCLL